MSHSNDLKRPSNINNQNKKSITYDDILSSLSMKVENGKLVITRDTMKEHVRAGIEPIVIQQQQQQQQQQQTQQEQQRTSLRNDKLLTNLRKQLDENKRIRETKSNKLFLTQPINCSKQRVQMNI